MYMELWRPKLSIIICFWKTLLTDTSQSGVVDLCNSFAVNTLIQRCRVIHRRGKLKNLTEFMLENNQELKIFLMRREPSSLLSSFKLQDMIITTEHGNPFSRLQEKRTFRKVWLY